MPTKPTYYTRTGTVGCCQICEGEFHLHNGKMVHHGFKRPGHGSIVGDCTAVGVLPYEISCEFLKSYTAALKDHLAVEKGHLANLVEGRITSLEKDVSKYKYAYGRGRVRDGEKITETYTNTETDDKRKYEWRRLFDTAVQQVEGHIRTLQMEIKRCDARIAAWTLRPVREITEEVLRMEKAEREAAKNTKEAERQAKRDAEQAKRDARLAKEKAAEDAKLALYAEWAAKFKAFADAQTDHSTFASNEAQAMVEAMRKAVRKAKLRGFQGGYVLAREMEIDEALIKLGLAARNDQGYVTYAGMFTY